MSESADAPVTVTGDIAKSRGLDGAWTWVRGSAAQLITGTNPRTLSKYASAGTPYGNVCPRPVRDNTNRAWWREDELTTWQERRRDRGGQGARTDRFDADHGLKPIQPDDAERAARARVRRRRWQDRRRAAAG